MKHNPCFYCLSTKTNASTDGCIIVMEVMQEKASLWKGSAINAIKKKTIMF